MWTTDFLFYNHDDVIKWKHFPCYWPFVRGIHRSPVNSPHKGQWRWALMFTLICAWINGWVNNREVGDLRCHRAHYDVIVMWGHSVCDTLELCNMEPQAMLCWHMHGSFKWYFRKPTLLCNTIFGVAQHSWLPDIVSTLLSAYKTAHSCLHRQALLQEL